MGYPENFKIVTKALTDNILLASSAFTRADKFNFGARMAILKYPVQDHEKIILWSPLPYTPQVVDTILKFTGVPQESQLKINYVIIPDREHNLAAQKYQDVFPECKIIGMEGIDSVSIDYKFTEAMGNKIIKGEELRLFIDDDTIVDNFEFVYLPKHANQELVVFEKKAKTLFEADLLFNLGAPGTVQGTTTLEQYSPELGYAKGFNPHSGWSFITRYLQPYSKVGRFLFRKLVDVNASKAGLEAIYSWDFSTIVMCHGNIITERAKEAFKHVFL
ncbi:hypothetical protein Cantr_02743 [Candida viswanathii]|uniref:Uncharacterized protein n=1 Tax=Candida viswanathii TaxID=5486 RepID=A0A367YLI1_9ASCO|nr:hypothetical protein Cantr_02743 [Candida viswanathii]